MNLGRVIGTVWATRKDPGLHGKRLLIVQPLTFERTPSGDPLIALDTVESGLFDHVIYVTSTEATIPFRPGQTPTDATIVGIVERVDTDRVSWKTGDPSARVTP